MKKTDNTTIWFAAGSQHLYGEQTLADVGRHASEIADFLDAADSISSAVEFKGVLTTSDEILKFCREAVADSGCGGVIFWMHTFSPSKMWIAGLQLLNKPVLHLHTQYNRDIPWDSIDMDFMNLNQSAHGGREHGFIHSRMKRYRKVVAGYWRDAGVLNRIDEWCRLAAAVSEQQRMRVARFGDNMRDVAVTEGDKVSAQIAFGFNVSAYGLSDLEDSVEAVSRDRTETLAEECFRYYEAESDLRPGGERYTALLDALRLEAGIEDFLEKGGFSAFTTTFENLGGLCQLPGLACQRLMNKGYGFGAEGDWKTAALVRLMKIMGRGRGGGTSFMEDYTYHLSEDSPLVLGAHMLEVCPSIAASGSCSLQIHPLGIGGKDDPLRLVFDVPAGRAVNAALMDMGGRFRLLINEVETVVPPEALPNLPVARAVWKPQPDLTTAAEAWIIAGGAHHTAFSFDVSTGMLCDWADYCGIESLVIDSKTEIRNFTNEIRWNDMYYSARAFGGV